MHLTIKLTYNINQLQYLLMLFHILAFLLATKCNFLQNNLIENKKKNKIFELFHYFGISE